jgi:Trypsin-like peptidase domain
MLDALSEPDIASRLGNSNDISIGTPVLLLGAPRGLEQSASEGIVASTRMDDSGTRLLQTSAAASPGSSGGPLLNDKAEAVGVLSFTLTQSQNLNFAVPINYVRGILDRLVAVAAQPISHLEPLAAMRSERLAAPAGSKTPVHARTREEALRASKTIYVRSSDIRLRAGATNQLRVWAKYTEVALSEQADLVLQMEVTAENNAGNGKASAQLIDRHSTQVLWAGSRGGAFTNVEKVGRQLIDDIQKVYEASQTPATRGHE